MQMPKSMTKLPNHVCHELKRVISDVMLTNSTFVLKFIKDDIWEFRSCATQVQHKIAKYTLKSMQDEHFVVLF
jgi:hypothetical protein